MYRLETGRFPNALSELGYNGIIDPNTKNTWDYTYAKDSVVISSPGYDQLYNDDGDISITLKKSSIKEYKNKIHSDFDRGYFAAWADYMLISIRELKNEESENKPAKLEEKT